uniref:ENTH domain-containing protein n=1 Tax=Trichuris muris TaxID=70415 RepID=A0A5S6QIL9_TRIMR
MASIFSGIQNIASNITSTLNTYEIRKLADKVQNAVMNYTEIESKVREATNEDPWGPTGPLMSEIAHATSIYDQFSEAMAMLWKRMFHENKRSWVRVYKSLILLEYLIRNGSERVISNARERMYDLRILESYQYTDERDRDQGQKIRHRVKEVIELLQDDERLQRERKIARFNKSQYVGISSNEYSSNSFQMWSHKPAQCAVNDEELGSQARVQSGGSSADGSSNECCDRKKQQEFTFPNREHDTVGQFDPRSNEHGSSEAAQIPRLPLPPTSASVKAPCFQDVTSVSGSNLLVEVFDASTAKVDADDWPGVVASRGSGIDEFCNFVASSKAIVPDEKKANIGSTCDDFTSFASYVQNLPAQPLTPACLQSSNVLESNAESLRDPFELGSIISEAPSQVPSCIPVAESATVASKPAEMKIPDTWSDIHKIGLDLNSLSLENKPRKQNALSMNELQEQSRRKVQCANPSLPATTSTQNRGTVNHGTFDTAFDLLS